MPNATSLMTLFCHPAASAQIIPRVEAGGAHSSCAHVAFRYRFHGEVARLRIPPPQTPARADGLWAHTCSEAFVGVPGKAAYREFNFSPSGQWAIYDFSDYRQRIDESPVSEPPRIATRRDGGCFELTAFVPLSLLPVGPWDIGLSAVLESSGDEADDNRLSYWALHHPLPRPDFHHRGGFVFRLEVAPAMNGK